MARQWSDRALRWLAGVLLALSVAGLGGAIWSAVDRSGRSAEADAVVTGHVEVKRSTLAVVAFEIPSGEPRTARVRQDSDDLRVGEGVRIRYVLDDDSTGSSAWRADTSPHTGFIVFMSVVTLFFVGYNHYVWFR